jgi:hypothetical protein
MIARRAEEIEPLPSMGMLVLPICKLNFWNLLQFTDHLSESRQAKGLRGIFVRELRLSVDLVFYV